jgi:hypothetical protein
MRLLYAGAILASICGTSTAQTIGGNSFTAVVNGIPVSGNWNMSAQGVLTQSMISPFGSQTRSWQAISGGCQDPVLGRIPVLGGWSGEIWTAACSSGVLCQSNRQKLKIESSIFFQVKVATVEIGGRQEVTRFIDDWFDLGPC